METVDFSIGNIQVCTIICESPGFYSREISVYIPEKDFCEQQSKKGIVTYKELLDNDKQERARQEEAKIDELVPKYREELYKILQHMTNKCLTQNQIETILNNLELKEIAKFAVINEDHTRVPYDIHITSNPDEFAKYLIYEKDSNWIMPKIVIGDSVNRK